MGPGTSKTNSNSNYLPTSHCTGERAKLVQPQNPEAVAAKGGFFTSLQLMPGREVLGAAGQSRCEMIISALVDGDINSLEEVLLSYCQTPATLVGEVGALAYVFRDSAISLLESEVFKVEDEGDSYYDAAVLKVWLRHARRVLYVPTDRRLVSCVFSVFSHPDGRKFLKQEGNEEPRLLARQIGRVLCHSGGFGPPPMISR